MAEAARKQPEEAKPETAEIGPLRARTAGAAKAEAPKPGSSPAGGKETAAGNDGGNSQSGGGERRKKLLVVAGSIAAIVIAYYALNWLFVGRYLISTDNAYVGADMSIVAPRVSGYVASVSVPANARVKTGDILVTLDDGDYRLAVEQAAARVATQDATILRLDRQTDRKSVV